MPLTEFEIALVETAMEPFMAKRRPPKQVREQVDLAFRFEDQSVILYEIRPFWSDPSQIIKEPIAKASYVRTSKEWKVFWQRADLKWHAYEPCPRVRRIKDFLALVDEDRYGSFWG
jgi:hypothetical protein